MIHTNSPRPLRSHLPILAALLFLLLPPNAFAQPAQPEAPEAATEPAEQTEQTGDQIEQPEPNKNKFALGLGLEWSMISRNYFAGGAGLAFDYNLFPNFGLGLSVFASSNFNVFTALEIALMYRGYFLKTHTMSFFLQADAGTFLYMEDGQTVPYFLGGVRTGFRAPLGRTLYIEPYARGGYPFAFGVGATIGTRFVPREKKPEPVVITEETKERIAEDIAEDIERLNITDVSVRVEDEGITISMDIQFRADTAIMLPGEREKLDKIIDILRRYVERKIMVSGHTALAGTAEGRERLSRERAAVVAAYIIEQKACTPDRMIVRGYGAERPLGDNNTDEGRRMNRRVEITLLD
jgi:outer membrane protein OmpA-like peptidoglycan-associated protein